MQELGNKRYNNIYFRKLVTFLDNHHMIYYKTNKGGYKMRQELHDLAHSTLLEGFSTLKEAKRKLKLMDNMQEKVDLLNKINEFLQNNYKEMKEFERQALELFPTEDVLGIDVDEYVYFMTTQYNKVYESLVH